MPWLIRMQDGQHCIYKEGTDGEPTGESLGCHASRDDAQAQLAALYASESGSGGEMWRAYRIAEFRGNYPDIAVDPRVDLSALTAGDEKPFFVTLPIAKVGEVSANGLDYNDELVSQIYSQLVGRGGIMGHIKENERDTAFPVEDVDWVGVARQQDGVIWAKGYIPPGEAREYIRRLKARGGALATSIYGRYEKRETLDDGAHRLRGFKLESLDLAPADRAALKMGGQFAITAQMQDDNTPTGDNHMPSKQEIIAELSAGDLPDALRQQIIQDYEQNTGQQRRISELETQVQDRDTLIAELQQAAEQRRVAEFETTLDEQIAEMTPWETKTDAGKEKVAALRRMLKQAVLAEFGDKRDANLIQETVDTVWQDYQTVAETVRDALAGPAAFVGGRQRGKGRGQLDVTPEATAAARAEWGL